MKRIVYAALAASLLAGTAVMAEPNHPNGPGQSDTRNGPGPNNQPGNQGWQVRSTNPRWSRGDRLSNNYRQNQYAVSDWQKRRLKKPRNGYRWYRDDNNNYFLVAIASGIIAQTIYQDELDQRNHH